MVQVLESLPLLDHPSEGTDVVVSKSVISPIELFLSSRRWPSRED